MKVFSDETVIELNKPFREDQVRSRKGRGVDKFFYISGDDIVERLNQSFSYAWSFEIRDSKEIGDHIVVLGRMIILTEAGMPIIREAYGSASIQKYGDKAPQYLQGKRIDAGNDYKSASSSAIKKIAAGLGIGVEDIKNAVGGGSAQSSTATSSPFGGGGQSQSQTTPATTEGSKPNLFGDKKPQSQEQPQTNPFSGGQPETRTAQINPFANTGGVETGRIDTTSPNEVNTPKEANTTQTQPNPFSGGQQAEMPHEQTSEQGAPPPNTSNESFNNVFNNTPAKASAAQIDAIRAVSRNTGVQEIALIQGAGIADKTGVLELTNEEAMIVIRYSNTLPSHGG